MEKPRDDQNFWNFWLLVLSGVLLALEIWILVYFDKLPTSIGIFDFVLISLATFRLTRLFVYDAIMAFVRDLFLKRTVSYTADNKIVITREKYEDGISRAISDMFSCPWCTGLQLAILVVFFYYLTAYSWIIILMFALGGVSTLLQLIANAVGWRAENLKRVTEGNHPTTRGGTCG